MNQTYWPNYLDFPILPSNFEDGWLLISIVEQRVYWLEQPQSQTHSPWTPSGVKTRFHPDAFDESWQGEVWIRHQWPISSAKNGVGNLEGSGKTPLGWHKIRLKIGEFEPMNRVFVGRRPTQEIFSASLAEEFPNRDWILSRILWLSGLQPGFNRRLRGQDEIDTLKRFIYIHGTPENPKEPIGEPHSHGCIRMQNQALIELFTQIHNNMPVLIVEVSLSAALTQLRLQANFNRMTQTSGDTPRREVIRQEGFSPAGENRAEPRLPPQKQGNG